jgi:drug/metabolite transporter (DMT)-like permease
LNRQGLLILLVAATAFSTLAIFMKVAFGAGANLTTLLAFRFLFSALLCFLALALTGKSLMLPSCERWRILGLGGVIHVAVSIFYAISVQLLPASLTGLIFYLYPAMVTGLAVLAGHEKMNRLKLTALVVCFAGLLQVMGVSLGIVSTTGLLFGIAAAFVQACHVLLSHAIVANLSPLLTVGWSALVTSTVFMVYGGISGELQLSLTLTAWGAVLGTAFFANFIGIVLFFIGMRRVGPTDASIIMNLEPVLTVILSVLLLGESFGWAQAAGGAIILSGLYILHQGETMG